MGNKALLEEIEKNMNTIGSHLRRIKENPDHLHKIDIEILSGRLKDVYSMIHELTEESSELGVGSEELVEAIVEKPDPSEPEPREPSAASEQPIETDPVPRPSYPEPKTTADLFSGPATIADSFQSKKDNSIAATVKPQGVQDLKMAIGINDKFLFINELFDGDPAVYNQAIESLNAAAGSEEAVHAMNGFREQYSWADHSEAYHRLKKIVNSKFHH